MERITSSSKETSHLETRGQATSLIMNRLYLSIKFTLAQYNPMKTEILVSINKYVSNGQMLKIINTNKVSNFKGLCVYLKQMRENLTPPPLLPHILNLRIVI